MGGILGVIVIVLDVLAILDCLKSASDTGRKALWVVLILLLPLVGPILYYLIEKKST